MAEALAGLIMIIALTVIMGELYSLTKIVTKPERDNSGTIIFACVFIVIFGLLYAWLGQVKFSRLIMTNAEYFQKIFPDLSVRELCPKFFDKQEFKDVNCQDRSCNDCRSEYWNREKM